MNPNTIGLIIQIITATLQLAPVAVSTVVGIKALLAADPAVPVELQQILNNTSTDNAAALAAIQAWLVDNPVA